MLIGKTCSVTSYLMLLITTLKLALLVLLIVDGNEQQGLPTYTFS